MSKPAPLICASKSLSLILRHAPGRVGLALDPEGWLEIEAVIARAPAALRLDRARIARVVAENDKKRFEISADGRRIRAVQGHSVPVDLGLAPQAPPERLFHGTAMRFLDQTLSEGLKPRGRTHVHLSIDEATAYRVGARHGGPAILEIDLPEAIARGQAFYRAANGVWLTDAVAPDLLRVVS